MNVRLIYGIVGAVVVAVAGIVAYVVFNTQEAPVPLVAETLVTPSAPPVTEAPAAPSAPPVTEAPAAPSAPPVTEAPAAPSAPAAAEAPAAPSAPAAAEAPAAPSAPAAAEAPAAPSAPAAAEAPAAPSAPAAAEAPAAPSASAAAEAPAAPSAPAAAEAPAAPSAPAAAEAPAAPSAPPAAEAPAAPSAPAAAEAPATPSAPPVAEAPAAPSALLAAEVPVAPSAPAAAEAPAASSVPPAAEAPAAPSALLAAEVPAAPPTPPVAEALAVPSAPPAAEAPATSSVPPASETPATPSVPPVPPRPGATDEPVQRMLAPADEGPPVAVTPEAEADAPATAGGVAPGPPASVGPSFDVVRIDREGNAVIAGRATPGAEVAVRSDDTELGRVTADPGGDWVLLPEVPAAPGNRELSLVQRDAQGVETPSDRVVLLVVPERGQDVAGREGDSEALAVLVPRQGEGATRVLQAPGAAVGGAVTGTLLAPEPSAGPTLTVTVEVIDYTTDGRMRLVGRAPGGARINAYLDNGFLGNTMAGADTAWEIAPDRLVLPGLYLLRVDQLDAAGQVAARVELPFMRAVPLADLPAGALVVVQPGNSLWRIARRIYGRGLQYTEIYAANANQIRDPELIYPGQIFALPIIQ